MILDYFYFIKYTEKQYVRVEADVWKNESQIQMQFWPCLLLPAPLILGWGKKKMVSEVQLQIAYSW